MHLPNAGRRGRDVWNCNKSFAWSKRNWQRSYMRCETMTFDYNRNIEKATKRSAFGDSKEAVRRFEKTLSHHMTFVSVVQAVQRKWVMYRPWGSPTEKRASCPELCSTAASKWGKSRGGNACWTLDLLPRTNTPSRRFFPSLFHRIRLETLEFCALGGTKGSNLGWLGVIQSTDIQTGLRLQGCKRSLDVITPTHPIPGYLNLRKLPCWEQGWKLIEAVILPEVTGVFDHKKRRAHAHPHPVKTSMKQERRGKKE